MGFGNKVFNKPELKKINDFTWEIPTSFKKEMKVPARIWSSKALVDGMDLHVYDQITNVATLPGLINYAMCMPDGHISFG